MEFTNQRFSFSYNADNLASRGYAGLPTGLRSERAGGQSQHYNSPYLSGSFTPPVGVAGISSLKYNSRIHDVCPMHVQSSRVNNSSQTEASLRHDKAVDPSTFVSSKYVRKQPTEEEKETVFSRTFVVTDNRNGRTEVMTTRRPGRAHLDMDPLRFDASKYYSRQRLKRPVLGESAYSHLETGACLPTEGSEIRHVPSRQITQFTLRNNEDHLQNEALSLTPRESPLTKGSLGYMKRKIDASWSRTQGVNFDLSGS